MLSTKPQVPAKGEELIGIKKRPDDLGIDNTASRVRALLAVHHLRRSPIEKKADKRYGRSSRTKPDKHNASLPYLKNEGRGRSQNRMTQSLTLQRNTSFPHKQPEQYGYETKLYEYEKHRGDSVLDSQRQAWTQKLGQTVGSHFDKIEIEAKDAMDGKSGSHDINLHVNAVERTRMKLPSNLPVLRLGVPKFKSNSLVVIQTPKQTQNSLDLQNVDSSESRNSSAMLSPTIEAKFENNKVAITNSEDYDVESVERPKSRFIHNLNERNISFFTELNVGPYDALERDMGKLGAQRVKGKQVGTINDRLSGIMRDRTEKLAEQLLSSKKDEEDMKSKIRTNIIERRRTLPLDFIFRRALKRYVKAHLEDGIKRWKSFVRRAQAVERLLKKVTPFAVTIQRHIRGYLGRKRAAVMREIRRVELKRLRINSATKLQVWWKLMILLQKIRIRTAKNLAAKQEKCAKKIQWCFRGHKSRSRVRRILRLQLTHAMRDILKYEHMLTEEEHIMMEACSAVLFDQRDDPRWEREQIYTSLDIRRATKLCNQINESRIKRAKKKRELNTQEIMREKQRMKRELLEKQKAKYEERLAKERARLIEIAKREEEETAGTSP